MADTVKRLRALLRETVSIDSLIAGEDTIGCSCPMKRIEKPSNVRKHVIVYYASRCQGTCLRARILAELDDG